MNYGSTFCLIEDDSHPVIFKRQEGYLKNKKKHQRNATEKGNKAMEQIRIDNMPMREKVECYLKNLLENREQSYKEQLIY